MGMIKNTFDLKRALRDGPVTFPGMYPVFFVTSDGAALSFKTVKENFRRVYRSVRDHENDGWRVTGYDVNWEDGDLCDDHTNERIESAYAEVAVSE